MNKLLASGLGVFGVLFLALAVYYFLTPANALLHFVPGYTAASSAPHIKHGLAALVLALAAGVLAWFSLGKKSGSETSGPQEQ